MPYLPDKPMPDNICAMERVPCGGEWCKEWHEARRAWTQQRMTTYKEALAGARAASQGEKKETNPKDAVGIKKFSMANVPPDVLVGLGMAMSEGALKYGRFNWRATGVRASVYFDAAMRHMLSYWMGQKRDPDSGIHHLVKAMACFAVLVDAEQRGKLTDDRPLDEDEDTIVHANEMMAALVEKYGGRR